MARVFSIGVLSRSILFGLYFQKFSTISLKIARFINVGRITSSLTVDVMRISLAYFLLH